MFVFLNLGGISFFNENTKNIMFYADLKPKTMKSNKINSAIPSKKEVEMEGRLKRKSSSGINEVSGLQIEHGYPSLINKI